MDPVSLIAKMKVSGEGGYQVICRVREQGSSQALLACRANMLSFAAATLQISPTRCRYAE